MWPSRLIDAIITYLAADLFVCCPHVLYVYTTLHIPGARTSCPRYISDPESIAVCCNSSSFGIHTLSNYPCANLTIQLCLFWVNQCHCNNILFPNSPYHILPKYLKNSHEITLSIFLLHLIKLRHR